MAGNVEDHVCYILRKRGLSDSCVRMADGYWMYGSEKYYSPVYSGSGINTPAWVATRLIEAVKKGQSEYIEDNLVSKLKALEPDPMNIPGADYGMEEVREPYGELLGKTVKQKEAEKVAASNIAPSKTLLGGLTGSGVLDKTKVIAGMPIVIIGFCIVALWYFLFAGRRA